MNTKKNYRHCIRFVALLSAMLALFTCSGCFGADFETAEGFYQVAAEAGEFELSEKASAFIKAHEELFPAANPDAALNYCDYELDYRQIVKKPESYGDKMLASVELYVVSSYETDLSDTTCMTEIHAVDLETDQSYYIFYRGSLEVFEDDVISAVLLPLGVYTFDNISGGTTISLACAGSFIEIE